MQLPAVPLQPGFIILETKMMYGHSTQVLTSAKTRLRCATGGIRAEIYRSSCRHKSDVPPSPEIKRWEITFLENVFCCSNIKEEEEEV